MQRERELVPAVQASGVSGVWTRPAYTKCLKNGRPHDSCSLKTYFWTNIPVQQFTSHKRGAGSQAGPAGHSPTAPREGPRQVLGWRLGSAQVQAHRRVHGDGAGPRPVQDIGIPTNRHPPASLGQGGGPRLGCSGVLVRRQPEAAVGSSWASQGHGSTGVPTHSSYWY